MTFISQGVHLITLIGIISCSPHVQMNMFSDLINMIGKTEDQLCNSNISVGSNIADKKSRPLLLSQYSFIMTTPACEELAITENSMRNFNWSCFTTGSSESRDINWLFVDCVRSKMASVKCLQNSQVEQIVASVCLDEQKRCKAFTSTDGQEHVCSNQFEIKSTTVEQKESIKNDARSFPSNMDIIACVCAIFILVTFILSVCIPAEKCKPTYLYDEEVGLRVPLEIYEIYGQHYKPSARRKAKTAFTKSVGSISLEEPHFHRFHTVAVIANSEMDPAPHGHYTETTPSATFLDTDMNGSDLENVFRDRIKLTEDRETSEVKMQLRPNNSPDSPAGSEMENVGTVMDMLDSILINCNGIEEQGPAKSGHLANTSDNEASEYSITNGSIVSPDRVQIDANTSNNQSSECSITNGSTVSSG